MTEPLLAAGSSAEAIDRLLDTGKDLAVPRTVAVGETEVTAWVIPADTRIAYAYTNLPQPDRRKGTVTVDDLPSFLSYFAKHANSTAEIYCNQEHGRITAVLNAAGGDDTSYNDHRLVLQVVKSPQYLRWTALDGKLIGQEPFAEFIEDNAMDIVPSPTAKPAEPTAIELLEIAQTFIAKKGLDFETATVLKNGRRTFVYKETLGAKAGEKGQLDIPDRLGLAFPVYAGAAAYRFTARFRYRIGTSADSLRLGMKFDNLEAIERDAFGQLVDDIRKAVVDPQLVLIGQSPAAETPGTDIRFA